MKKVFVASLCRNGLLGGGIIADDEGITYRTGKLTIPQKFRNLEMKYGEIRAVTKDRLLCLPTVSVTMKDGESYRFLVFGRGAFCRLLAERVAQ